MAQNDSLRSLIVSVFVGVCGIWLEPVFSESAADDEISAVLEQVNADMAKDGLSYCIGMMETQTHPNSGEKGRTIVARDLGKDRLRAHFVPGDPRRGGRRNITYLIDRSDAAPALGPNAEATEEAIDRAMATWGQLIPAVPIEKLEDMGGDYDKFDFFLAIRGILAGTCKSGDFSTNIISGNPDIDQNGTVDIDILHGGWLPACAFSWIQGGDSILAVTVTWVYLDENRNPSDINGDGRPDTAFREIFYNNRFAWSVSGESDEIDLESVALHEAGHGFSMGHYGTVFSGNNTYMVKPLAVMNQIYTGIRRTPYPIDKVLLTGVWRGRESPKPTVSHTLRRR